MTVDDYIKRIRERLEPPVVTLPVPEEFEQMLVNLVVAKLLNSYRSRCEAIKADGERCQYRVHPDSLPYCRVHWSAGTDSTIKGI